MRQIRQRARRERLSQPAQLIAFRQPPPRYRALRRRHQVESTDVLGQTIRQSTAEPALSIGAGGRT